MKSLSSRTLLLWGFLAALALGTAAFAAEKALQVVSTSIAQSQNVRVAEVNSCQVSAGTTGTHFVGCSSIL